MRYERKMDKYPTIELAPERHQNADDFLTATANEPVCTIGELARRFDLTHRTLRFYESRGLLNPVRRGNNRVYGARDVERLAVIVKAKKLGLTLTAIRQILGGADSGQTLRLNRETCLAQIAALERKLAQTREALAELRAMCGVCDDRSDR
jgi:DNA-binding transcriptional MerR regulator